MNMFNINAFLEYISIHKISLQQDQNELAEQMQYLDPDTKDFAELDFEYNYLAGQIHALGYILEEAKEF